MSAPATRIATLADLEQVAALLDAYRQFYSQPADLPLAMRFIAARLQNNESLVLVAEATQAQDPAATCVTGFCQLYPGFCSVLARPVYTLYDLYVAPAARKAGTSRALLLAAHAHAAANGFARLDLSTAHSNQAAQALYESLGWVRDDGFLSYSLTV